jgi:subtilisin-like proprotein convertase family protein
MTLTAGKGTWYIDPYTKEGDYYMAYKREELQTARTFKCLTQDVHTPDAETQPDPGIMGRDVNDNGNFRTYRLAVVTTVEYSNFHITAAGLQAGTLAQKKAAVISAIVVTMTRVNTMYERDMSVSLQLIPQNDEIVFIDSDELTNDDAGALLGEGHDVMMDIIGTDSFGTAGGGLAAGAPCTDFKGGAMTGLGSPVGDPFDIDYVSHEMGHQFGAGHTFNAECGGNRAPETAFETGGGTTILAYAGICDPVVQWSSDAQFHPASINQMRNRINSISNCVPLVNSGNTPPVANAGNDYVIPMGTAFILEGSAIDADGDALTYMWDQMNNEISEQPPVPTATGGPNFRPLPISESPDRWMPRIEDVLNNDLAPQWEVIPTVGRDLDFAFTVRDNNINGGESHIDYMHIDVVQGAGPFTVVTPNTNVSWQAASNQVVAWNVAGTTGNGVNTPYVDILLSADGGFTYPFVLASMVPNDGLETVLIPNSVTPGRIMVRGHNNIFYDLSNTNFNITASGSTFIANVTGGQNKSACKGSDVTYTLNYSHINGFTGTTTFSATGNPAGSVVTFSPATMTASGTVQVTVSNTAGSPVALHNIVVTMTSGATQKTIPLYLNLLNNQFPGMVLTSPANNTDGIDMEVTLDWADNANASAFIIEVASDEAFNNMVAQATVSESNFPLNGLSESTIFYWRVTPVNDGCGGVASDAFRFATGDAFCEDYASTAPLGIPGNAVATVTSQINVTDNFLIENITVPINITHTWITDLTVKLISPAGTEVMLFGDECGDQDDANAIFDDNGEELNCNGTPAITGIVMPEEALSAFIGENSQGIWTLEVFDSFDGDGGAVNTWSVNLCGVNSAELLEVASVENFEFSIYPNPNNGTFNVQFDSADSGNVTIQVYDMRGRRIYEKQSLATGGIFNDSIQLSAQSGIYLVNIEHGGKTTSKKIIIN